MDKEIQELLQQIALENFFVKSSKGNYLAVTKNGDRWIAQGKEVRRQQDIEYLNKQYEDNLKDLTKTYNNLMDELQHGLWDSGNLSIAQNKILDYLLEKGIVVRIPGVPGEHDTINGTAKWIYSLNEDNEDEQLHNRLTNKKKSKESELAWKRHHASYMRGARERSRNTMNKTFYGVAKEIEGVLSEAAMTQDNEIDKQLDITFEHLSGGVGLTIDDQNNDVSISVQLKETGAGNYKAIVGDPQELNNLFQNLKTDILSLCRNFDDEIAQLVNRYGLKSTK